MEESIGILYQSGFEENLNNNSADGGSTSVTSSELIYKKKDLGLLYLVKSILESIHSSFTRD